MAQDGLNGARAMVLEVRDGGAWSVLGQLWVRIESMRPRLRIEAGEEVAVVQLRLIVRGAQPGDARRPAPGQRLRDGARTYAVRAVVETDATGRFLELLAEEAQG